MLPRENAPYNFRAAWNHDEADTRLMVFDASACGYQRIMIRTNDTDVVVLAISIANTIQANENTRRTCLPTRLPQHLVQTKLLSC